MAQAPALPPWLEESAHKDSDALTLQKYAQQDDNKIRVRCYTL